MTEQQSRSLKKDLADMILAIQLMKNKIFKMIHKIYSYGYSFYQNCIEIFIFTKVIGRKLTKKTLNSIFHFKMSTIMTIIIFLIKSATSCGHKNIICLFDFFILNYLVSRNHICHPTIFLEASTSTLCNAIYYTFFIINVSL